MNAFIDKLISLEILTPTTGEDSVFENTYKVNEPYTILYFGELLIYIIEKTETTIICYNIEGLQLQSADCTGNFINEDPENLKIFKQIEI